MRARILARKSNPGNRGGLHYSQFRRYLATRTSQIQLLAFRPRRENRRPLSPIREVGLCPGAAGGRPFFKAIRNAKMVILRCVIIAINHAWTGLTLQIRGATVEGALAREAAVNRRRGGGARSWPGRRSIRGKSPLRRLPRCACAAAES